MDSVIAFAAENPVSAWLILAVLALVVLAIVIWLVRRLPAEGGGEEAAQGPAPDPGGGQASEQVSARAAPGRLSLRESFARAMALLRRAVPGRNWRYASPWILVMGETGSGKRTLLGGVDLDRPFGASSAISGNESEPDCTWHFFDQGVVLDLAGELVARPDLQPGDDVRWREFTRLLQHHRPERGLDGIVLTISCTDLTGPDQVPAEVLIAKGDALYRRLWDLQQQIGLRLPVYVVVTKCDHVAGFRGFWQQARKIRRREMFGWSNRNNLEAAYGAHLVDAAFAEIGEDLQRAYVAAAADLDEPADPDGMFLFPGEFRRLAEPLKPYLDRLFRASAYHEAFFFRGLYFVGDGGSPDELYPRAMLPPAGRADLPAMPARVQRPIFATELFGEKIFAESRLARAASSGLISRNRTVLAVQSAMLLLAVVLGVGTWFASQRLDRTVADLMPSVVLITEETSGHARGAPVGELVSEQAEHLLRDFSDIQSRSLTFLFLPSSWVSGLEDRLVGHFAYGFDHVIAKPMHAKLNERALRLVEEYGGQAPAAAETKDYALAGAADFRRLSGFVSQMHELDRNAASYETLRGGDLAEVARLADYLFGVRLNYDFTADSDLYAAALRRIEVQPLDRLRYRNHVSAAMRNLDAALAQRLSPNGPVAARVQALARAIDEVDRVQSRREDASAALGRLADASVAVKTMIEDPEFHWLLLDRPEEDPAVAGLLAMMRDSAFFEPGADVDLRRRFAERSAALREALLSVRTRLTGPVLTYGPPGPALHLSDELDRLAASFLPVFRHAFMQVADDRRPMAASGRGMALGWSTEGLDRVLELYRGYEEFQARDLGALPAGFRPVVERLGRQRLRANLLAGLADAQTRARRTADPIDVAGEAALAADMRGVRAAAPSLISILGLLRQLGFDDAYMLLRDIVGNQAVDLLMQVDELAESEQPYAAVDEFRGWDGLGRPSEAGFLAADDVALAQYLDGARNRLVHLSKDFAAPLIELLLRDELGGTWRGAPVVTKWQRIGIELQRYQANSPLSTVTALEHFVRFELDTVKPETCFEQLGDAERASSGDFFQQRRIMLRRQLLDQCRWIAGSSVQRDYDRLVADFNATLAGRYPFADFAQGADTPEVEPAELVDFLLRFEQTEAALRAGLAKGAQVDPAARAALGFVEQIAAVRDFAAPLMGGSMEEAGPAYDVEVEFRVNRPREAGGNQIIDWTVDLGGQRLVRGHEQRTARWRPGDPVSISLRWAKDAPMVPLPSGGADAPAVEDRTVTYSYTNRWSLVRALEAHRSMPADFERLADPQPHTLRFVVPTGAAPVEGVPAVQPEAGDAVRVFVRLSTSSAGSDGKERRRHVLPQFPHRAPAADLASAF